MTITPVSFTVTEATPVFGLPDFETPLLITGETPLDTINFVAPSYRQYNDLPTVGVDFGTASETYKAINALMSQERKPEKFYIYARSANIAQVKTLTLSGTTLSSGCKINGKINGLSIAEVPFNTDEATTLADLDTAITAMNGVAGVTVSSRVLTITANAGTDLSISDFEVTLMANPGTFAVATTTAGYNSVDAYNAFLLQKTDFRGVYHVSPSGNLDTLLSLARAVEATGRIFYCNHSSSTILNNDANNMLALMKAMNLSRTMFLYHQTMGEYAGAAMMAKLMTYRPGEAQAAWKDFSGVTVSSNTDISTTQESNILGNNGNIYKNIEGLPSLWRGHMTDGGNWDIRNDTDFALSLFKQRALQVFKDNAKPQFTDNGIALMTHAINTAKKDLEEVYGILVEGSTILYPSKASSFTGSQKAQHILNNYRIACTFTGSYDSFDASISFSF